MRYCENAGLSGRLLLEHRGRLAIGYYEKGELSDVSIDGGTAAGTIGPPLIAIYLIAAIVIIYGTFEAAAGAGGPTSTLPR